VRIGIYLYDDAEVLDFAGPFEVFSTAARLAGPEAPQVLLLAEEPRPLRARGGFSVIPHHSIADHPALDVLVVAGGVHGPQLHRTVVLAWLRGVAGQARIVASVCTGVFLLAEAGLLDGLSVTTHWEDVDALRAAYPGLQVIEGRRWVDEGRFVSSGGISAGIDMSLHLVSRLFGPELAQRTARQMEFDWRRNSHTPEWCPGR